ncbi:MAG: class A beta-lactamase-related serine hydrolase [Clostridiales bacterium]|jgi:beta-lactamase class A|nr:class A beta-lactamase-related serine hydrolase [Clostridiales bacterium]
MNLQEEIETLLEGFAFQEGKAFKDCKISALCQDLSSGEPSVSIEPHRAAPSASVIKVPILLCALQTELEGRLSLDDLVDVRKEDILDDSDIFDSGPRKASILELLTWMIIKSDNTSTNALIELLGFKAVSEYAQSIGMKKTALSRKMLDFQAVSQGRDNFTSASDMLRLFKNLFSSTILSPQHCSLAIRILRKQRDNSMLSRYIWQDDVKIAHKTGGLKYLSHDCGVLSWPSRDVYLGVFIHQAAGIKGNPRLIGEIAKRVYERFKP